MDLQIYIEHIRNNNGKRQAIETATKTKLLDIGYARQKTLWEELLNFSARSDSHDVKRLNAIITQNESSKIIDKLLILFVELLLLVFFYSNTDPAFRLRISQRTPKSPIQPVKPPGSPESQSTGGVKNLLNLRMIRCVLWFALKNMN